MFSQFSADRPLTTQEEDSLGRVRFAESLARVLRGRRDLDSYVVALYGPWGCGKTSLKNMALEKLRAEAASCPIIVEFEPWLWNDVAQLTQAFFDEIGAALESESDIDDKAVEHDNESTHRRARQWRRYSAFFTAAGMLTKAAGLFQAAQGQTTDAAGLAVMAGQLDEAAKATQHAQGWVESAAQDEQKPPISLFEMRKELARSLRELERPVLVVIDDIDRLNAREIAALFQLVKSNANFPNWFIYCCFSAMLWSVDSKPLHQVQDESFWERSFKPPSMCQKSMRWRCGGFLQRLWKRCLRILEQTLMHMRGGFVRYFPMFFLSALRCATSGVTAIPSHFISTCCAIPKAEY